MNDQHGSSESDFLFGVIGLVLMALSLYGWVMNIVKLAHMCCDISGMLVVRIIGVFVAPIGVVLGYIG